ncbi:MAG: hypothetical protein LBD48_00555 [Treponema sp.]|jgi:hypothetical protein|nr:hypothetical protein [Treponema sp.]
MKKTLLMVIIGLALAGTAFAQSYAVQNCTGRIEREVSGGKWEALKTGDILTADMTIRTGVNSSLVLKSGEQTFVIGAVQTGKVSVLAGNTVSIRIEGKVSQTDTGSVSRSNIRVGTASARAGDAANEEDIAAE